MAKVSCFMVLEIRHLKVRIPEIKSNDTNWYIEGGITVKSQELSPEASLSLVEDHCLALQMAYCLEGHSQVAHRCGYLSYKDICNLSIVPHLPVACPERIPLMRGHTGCSVRGFFKPGQKGQLPGHWCPDRDWGGQVLVLGEAKSGGENTGNISLRGCSQILKETRELEIWLRTDNLDKATGMRLMWD